MDWLSPKHRRCNGRCRLLDASRSVRGLCVAMAENADAGRAPAQGSHSLFRKSFVSEELDRSSPVAVMHDEIIHQPVQAMNRAKSSRR